jgi:hypothetical protein
MSFLKIFGSHTGLTNQIYAICGTICTMVSNNLPLLIVGDFQQEVYSSKVCSVDDVFDLEHLNSFLNKYNVRIITQDDLKLQILFGLENNTIDITDFFHFKRVIYIPKTLNIVKIKGDPIPFREKKIYIKYSIDNVVVFQREYSERNEYLQENVKIDTSSLYKDAPNWRTSENKDMFDELLVNLHFNPMLTSISCNFVKSFDESRLISVIHLKNEEVCMKHYANIYKISVLQYRKMLEAKYIELIDKYINKEDIIIILSYKVTDDPVIEYLQKQNYDVQFNQKNIQLGREMNAAVDMTIGEHCNSTFLGPCQGSTFSEMLNLRMNKKKKLITFDLDDLKKVECII